MLGEIKKGEKHEQKHCKFGAWAFASEEFHSDLELTGHFIQMLAIKI